VKNSYHHSVEVAIGDGTERDTHVLAPKESRRLDKVPFRSIDVTLRCGYARSPPPGHAAIGRRRTISSAPQWPPTCA
jgi:hypothetical protein